MQQDFRGPLGQAYVPEPRTAEHDDEDVAVGTAHAPQQRDPEGDGADERYPAGTYSSGSADADQEAADQEGVEVVDRDAALAEDGADQRDVLAPHPGEDVIGERVDDDVREDARDGDTAYQEAVGEDDEPGERVVTDADRADEAAPEVAHDVDVDEAEDAESEEQDEVATAAAEQVEDERWQSEHHDDHDHADHADHADQDHADHADQDHADHADQDHDDHADRAWAAQHATQLRAGALDERDDTTADGGEAVESESRFVPVPAAVAERGEPAQETAPQSEDDAAAQSEVVAVEEPAELRPGAVEAVPIGALWADGASDGLRERWRELQLRFIDEPRAVADEADQLVAEAVASITSALESQRQQLQAWQGEGAEDTERLRAAVRRYRDFLDRLLGL
jgi:hypothetical protein